MQLHGCELGEPVVEGRIVHGGAHAENRSVYGMNFLLWCVGAVTTYIGEVGAQLNSFPAYAHPLMAYTNKMLPRGRC